MVQHSTISYRIILKRSVHKGLHEQVICVLLKTDDVHIPQVSIPGYLGGVHHILGRSGRLCTYLFLVPLCQDDMEPTSYPVGGHDLRDIIVGLNQVGGRRWKEEWRGGCHILMVLWAIWLHINDKIFSRRVASMDGAAYAVEGFVAAWSARPRGERTFF